MLLVNRFGVKSRGLSVDSRYSRVTRLACDRCLQGIQAKAHGFRRADEAVTAEPFHVPHPLRVTRAS